MPKAAANLSRSACAITGCHPMSPVLLRASGPTGRERAMTCRPREGPRGSKSYPPAAGRVLPGLAAQRCSHSLASLFRGVGPPSCHANLYARDGASEASPRLCLTPKAWAGYWSVLMSPSLLRASGPMGRAPEEVRPCYRASDPARLGSDLAHPASFRPTDWPVGPKLARRTLVQQSPPRRSIDISCRDPRCGY
jgi:hypothetical protein